MRIPCEKAKIWIANSEMHFIKRVIDIDFEFSESQLFMSH